MLTIGTDTYIDVAGADAYITGRYTGRNADRKRWQACPTEDKEVYLRNACLALESLPFRGRKASYSQPLAFPRLPYQYGAAEGAPDGVKFAQVELALWMSDESKQVEQSQRSELQAQGVENFSLGDLSESYMGGAQASPVLLCSKAAALLRPYLSGGFAAC